MAGARILFDFKWDVDKYKSNYDPEYWELCRTFMEIHKTKYPEQKLVHLTEAFYQIGVYGSSYDPKTTRMVSALGIEVLDDFLKLHPGTLKHPFDKTAVLTKVAAEASTDSSKRGDSETRSNQPTSIWDVSVDKTILVNILVQAQLEALFKGFVIIYDIRRASTMNDNKVTILEDSFKRSKFGVLHWEKTETNNNVCPIRMKLKWKNVMLAQAEGSDEKVLRTRIAQAVLSKMAFFSPGVEAKWSYYRDGRAPDVFEVPNMRRVNIYKILRRSQFSAMAEITSFIDTFANSDSYAEIVFGMDFNSNEKKQVLDYVSKSWGTTLTYRTVNKSGVKNKGYTHICVYHIRTGDELRRWLEQNGNDNERYRLIGPGKHRRAGLSDNNVREILTTSAVDVPPQAPLPTVDLTEENKIKVAENSINNAVSVANSSKDIGKDVPKQVTKDGSKEKAVKISEKDNEDDLEKVLDGFVLFYDANKDSKIDKDDWFTALCRSFEISKFGPLEVVNENIRPLRTKCTFKWQNMTLASAEGLTETQSKTAATLQLISKLEPFTYIIQAKEDYFYDGKIPPFVTDSASEKNGVYRVVSRQDLPSYYSIFQAIDEFTQTPSFSELIFGKDFTWELKNEILVYLKAKELDYRFFTIDNEKPPTHLAVYHIIKPEVLKKHLLEKGGENEKYKLIPPPKAELVSNTTNEAEKQKEKVPEKKPTSVSLVKTTEKPSLKSLEKPPLKTTEKSHTKFADKTSLAKLAEKRKQPEDPPVLELETNKIFINLKKFKKDKVEYPEDTGGDFPGLILWVGIKKNSTWQKSLFRIMQESFRMSKYGKLTVEECEETVWSRKEPLKKCVIKSNRKVIGVGLGESKTEAKNLVAQHVCKQLRKHCYTIQAKESYFKEGKGTPYDFNPDPAKKEVYSVLKRDTFKNQSEIIKYVDNFSKNVKDGEVILGEDFTYVEREAVLDYCRKINLSYRLMKCHSHSKNMHTHVAIFHERSLPALKAILISAGGENDMFRLIPPGGKVTVQTSNKLPKQLTMEDLKEILVKCGGENDDYRLLLPGNLTERDLWPDTLDNCSIEDTDDKKPTLVVSDSKDLVNSLSKPTEIVHETPLNSENNVNSKANTVSSDKIENVKNKTKQVHDVVDKESGSKQLNSVGPDPQQVLPTKNQPLSFGPQPQPANFMQSYPCADPTMMNLSVMGDPALAEAPFGFQPFGVPCVAFQEMPLVFGPQPTPVILLPDQPADTSKLPASSPKQAPEAISENSMENALKKTDLRQELAKKRQAEGRKKRTPDRQVYDMTPERTPTNADDSEESWSRKVFLSDTEGSKEKPDYLRDKFRRNDLKKKQKWSLEKDFIPGRSGRLAADRNSRRISPSRDHQRMSPERQRQNLLPVGQRQFSPGPSRRFSPGRDNRRISPERGRSRNIPREESWSQGETYERYRNSSHERRFPHDISSDSSVRNRRLFSMSPRRSPNPFREERSYRRSPSPTGLHERFGRRDLWDNISALYSDTIFLYKYVKQDSTTETDPIALLKATRSLEFNIDFDFIAHQISRDKWQVEVELVTDDSSMHPLVGEGVAQTELEATLMAAHHAVDTMQKACRVIEPNYHYFAEGNTPGFILRRSPRKTHVYEIIQNLDPTKPLDIYTVDIMLTVFMQSDLEDIFFLASDFSYFERAIVIEHPNTSPDDIVSTQHVCVSKQNSALQLVRELLANGGSTERYTLVDPRERRDRGTGRVFTTRGGYSGVV